MARGFRLSWRITSCLCSRLFLSGHLAYVMRTLSSEIHNRGKQMFLERYDPLKQEMVCILAPDGSCNEALRPALDKQQAPQACCLGEAERKPMLTGEHDHRLCQLMGHVPLPAPPMEDG